jgi:small subunit ribosomal protein S16
MSVKIRLTRIGRRNRPFFRINAIESRTPRNGRILEKIGHYDPIEKDPAKQLVLNKERVQYWLDKGAIPSDTVSQILLRQGIKNKWAKERKARRAKARILVRKKGLPFTKAEKLAAQKLAAEKQAAQKQAAEKQAAQKQAAEKQAAEKQAAEKQAAEKLAAQKQAPPAEQKPEAAPIAEAKPKTEAKPDAEVKKE